MAEKIPWQGDSVKMRSLLCALGIIMVLATLACGPASRVLRRARADQWAERAEIHLAATATQLHSRTCS